MKVFIPPTKRYDPSILAELGIEVVGSRWDALSITGYECALMCRHCFATVLASMAPARSVEEVATRFQALGVPEWVLLSGGCDSDGRVPLHRATNVLKYLKSLGIRICAHTGLIDRQLGEVVKAFRIDIAMFDVFSVECAESVRNLKGFTRAKLENSLELCEDLEINCVPHIVIGENCGKPSGEEELLELLASYTFKQVNLVVFTPLPGTPFENCDPPSFEYVVKILSLAREKLSSKLLALGCMKPCWGKFRNLEIVAHDLGFDAIAAPSLYALRNFSKLGLTTVFLGCCSSLSARC